MYCSFLGAKPDDNLMFIFIVSQEHDLSLNTRTFIASQVKDAVGASGMSLH